MEEEFVIDLGGSIICPEGKVNVNFLKKFVNILKREIKKGKKFIVVTGGGAVAREYQKAAGELGVNSNRLKDWIGTEATKLNALLLKSTLNKFSHPLLFDERGKIKTFRRPLIVASGWNPGYSTDFVACQIALDFSIKKVITLGAPDYVYTADPKKDKNAKPIALMNWDDYFKIIPKRWQPGMNIPVDPVAAKLAREKGLEILVIGGNDLKNFEKFLKGKDFKGTVIF